LSRKAWDELPEPFFPEFVETRASDDFLIFSLLEASHPESMGKLNMRINSDGIPILPSETVAQLKTKRMSECFT
jgi:hypothetical protein